MKDFIGFIEEIQFIGGGSTPPVEDVLMKDNGTDELRKDDNTSNLLKG